MHFTTLASTQFPQAYLSDATITDGLTRVFKFADKDIAQEIVRMLEPRWCFYSEGKSVFLMAKLRLFILDFGEGISGHLTELQCFLGTQLSAAMIKTRLEELATEIHTEMKLVPRRIAKLAKAVGIKDGNMLASSTSSSSITLSADLPSVVEAFHGRDPSGLAIERKAISEEMSNALTGRYAFLLSYDHARTMRLQGNDLEQEAVFAKKLIGGVQAKVILNFFVQQIDVFRRCRVDIDNPDELICINLDGKLRLDIVERLDSSNHMDESQFAGAVGKALHRLLDTHSYGIFRFHSTLGVR